MCKRKGKEEGKRSTQPRILTTTDSRILGFLQPEVQTQGMQSSVFVCSRLLCRSSVHCSIAASQDFFLRKAERMRKRLKFGRVLEMNFLK